MLACLGTILGGTLPDAIAKLDPRSTVARAFDDIAAIARRLRTPDEGKVVHMLEWLRADDRRTARREDCT
jgi:hypothetical protein